ncbi:beta-galactosidase [Cryptomeria japonica]|uniref:beta-galactosidase n=1 Tax=Cryptomeria japonica TaxID=3369 RepID=UPI0027DA2AB2|nr:beta-galactosidase [Cryptomeria japonica]
MWPGLIDKAKEGGLDCIQTYVFWNMHEPKQGQYNFEGRFDLVKFVKIVQSKGLYVNLRIGPYINAEWNYGGIPYWVHDIPGITFRTDNEPFKKEMQRFTEKIVSMMKGENMYASQGGPIILQQIENEYQNVEAHFGESGHSYVEWAASMVVALQTGVPWTMCKQDDAPDNVIDTCNGMYCGDRETFTSNSTKEPKIWTENWTGWFQVFGGRRPQRPVEDIAYAVARFVAKKGTFVNYYMYHGGTNLGRSGGPFVTPSYDYDAPIDEYGIIRQPKWGHLRDLHKAVKLCSIAILFWKSHDKITLGPSQEAHVFRSRGGECAAFLSNMDPKSDVTISFFNLRYYLPAWSVSILPDCRTVIFNTAMVNSQTNLMKSITPYKKMSPSKILQNENVDGFEKWQIFEEHIGVLQENSFKASGLLEHISTTKDMTDYLWYTISINVDKDEPFLKSDKLPILGIVSQGYCVLVFINNILAGRAHGNVTTPRFKLEQPVYLHPGKNDIALLSMTVGLPNSGPLYERKVAGITEVTIQGFRDGARDLSKELWTYQVGLGGEKLELYTESGSKNVNWSFTSQPPSNQPMTWYKTRIHGPRGNEPVALDLSSMGKGQAWVNGEHIGRYWISYHSLRGNCSRKCDYRGRYNRHKCESNCGQPSQRLYHIPRSLLHPMGNVLVLFEETGGNPSKVALSRWSLRRICAHISERHHSSVNLSQKMETDLKILHTHTIPTLRLECPVGKMISFIMFVSFGNPQGECGHFIEGTCHSIESRVIAEKACLGQRECFLEVSSEAFGADPCVGTMKSLAIEAICS